MAKVTDWFPSDVNPVRVGWYEREYYIARLQKHCDWWDGKNWYSGACGRKAGLSTYPRRWRGLASQPSKGGSNA